MKDMQREKGSMAYFKVLSWYLYEETDKNTKKLNNYCHFPV
jgi:hypothetical protein